MALAQFSRQRRIVLDIKEEVHHLFLCGEANLASNKSPEEYWVYTRFDQEHVRLLWRDPLDRSEN